jgi:hypothetical protein
MLRDAARCCAMLRDAARHITVCVNSALVFWRLTCRQGPLLRSCTRWPGGVGGSCPVQSCCRPGRPRRRRWPPPGTSARDLETDYRSMFWTILTTLGQMEKISTIQELSAHDSRIKLCL